MEKSTIKAFLAEYANPDHVRTPFCSNLLEALVECRAKEKDQELRNELLSDLVLHYSMSIKTLINNNRLKDKFLRIAAHDLSGPLNAIRGLSDILRTQVFGPLNEQQTEYIETINTASSGILSLVNELLDVSLIESGRLQLRMEKGSLEKLIRERIQLHRLLADEKEITLYEEYAAICDQVFDHNKIAQVIDNLLGNAIKFSPFNSSILVSLTRKAGKIDVSVRDRGPGILDQDQSIIFNEFQKAGARPTGGEKCTGLGLAIAKRIIDAHQGTLRVESQMGSGSTFSFELAFNEDAHEEETKGTDCR